ncbi:MAG: Lytic transglycosylase catalytic [Thermoleophilia bacterium]|nr:Lytic transglycosylase catalytic [Thermoleophilia bacterium]
MPRSFKHGPASADASHERAAPPTMADLHPRTRTLRRILTPALVAMASAAIAAGVAGPAAAAGPTLEFTNVQPVAQQPATPISFGLPTAAAPKLGVHGKVAFRLNPADRRARTAAKLGEQARAKADANRAAAAQAQDRIAAITELLEQTQGDEERLRAEIYGRLVEQYKAGDAGDLEFLLSGDGLSDIVRRNQVLGKQSRADQRTFEEYDLTRGRLEDLKLALQQLSDINGEQATRLEDRASRLDERLVAARVGHMEADDIEPAKGKAVTGTWYVMDGAFSAQLFMPTLSSSYSGGTRTPRRMPTALEIQTVLSDPRIQFDASGIGDVSSGQIDGRILDALELAAQQFGTVKVSSLKSDHPVMTASGNVSEHSMGCAADIGTIGHTYITPSSQTPGSEVEQAVRFFMGLGAVQPDLAPHQVISLFDLGGASLAMGDHDDHIHLGYSC